MQFPVDAHVHLHSAERVASALDMAADNLGAWSTGTRALGALLLTEARDEDVFTTLVPGTRFGQWTAAAVAAEPHVRLFERQSGLPIIVVCGRQVRAAGGLEVLALGTMERFAENRPLQETAEAVIASGALAVIPWGFLKWLGGRGREVEALITRADPDTIFMGDNGGRMRHLPRHRLLRAGEARGMRTLPGSDPFPFPSDGKRTGAFGFLAGAEPDLERPWEALSHWVQQLPHSPPAYGQLSAPARFFTNQLRIQLFNRRTARYSH